MRVGWGFDAHRFAPIGKVLLAGVVADADRGVVATSDGDVVAHAVADAVLGAAALGDLGTFYPSDDSRWAGANSMRLLGDAVTRSLHAGWKPASVDVTVVAQTVRVGPLREPIREALAAVLRIPIDAVSLKATTTDGMGFIGRDDGIAAVAVVTSIQG